MNVKLYGNINRPRTNKYAELTIIIRGVEFFKAFTDRTIHPPGSLIYKLEFFDITNARSYLRKSSI